MALTRPQRKVARKILNVGTRRGESRKEKLAALATALTEANLGNPAGGSGTSAGWRQEIDSYGSVARRRNVKGAAKRFYDETSQQGSGKGMTVGQLSQAVQRSAYPDRYQTHVGDAAQILRNYNQGRLGAAPQAAGSPRRRTVTKTLPGTDLSAERSQARISTLQQSKGLPSFGQLLGLKQTLNGLVDTPPKTLRIPGAKPIKNTVKGGNKQSPDTGRPLQGIVSAANRIDRKQYPYVWGGGHSAKVTHNGPMDCSGAVSRALGINPRVSGQFASWGKPGRGKKVTVYANAGHVLLEVNGRFWGTSGSNPGGGAGWIKERPSASYLAGFTKRHPKNL